MEDAVDRLNGATLSNKDLTALSFHLGRINKILEKHSPDDKPLFCFSELNNHEKIDHIINGVCSFYDIPRDFVSKFGVGNNADLWDCRKYLTVLLYERTGLTFKNIAPLLGFKTHANVIHHYKTLKNQLSKEYYGDEKSKQTYNDLLKHLML